MMIRGWQWKTLMATAALAAASSGCFASTEPVGGAGSELAVACGANTDALVAEDGTNMGSVVISNDADSLDFAISASSAIAAVRIYAGVPPDLGGPVPFGCTSETACDLLLDNLNVTLASPATSASFSLAWADLPLQCGADVKLIVKVTFADGTVAWARAEDPGLHYENVYWEYYAACIDSCTPPPPPSDGCTLTQGFWKTHPEAWPVASLTLGTRSYSQAEALVLFGMAPRGNASLILAHQLMAAKLNVASGAATPGTSIGQADAWIAAHQALGMSIPFDTLSRSDRAEGIALAAALDSYNNGLSGPAHCD